jgi:hypothetical protein
VREATLVEKPAFKTGDKLSFVYVGGLSKWQKFEHTLDIYKDITKQLKTDFTIITAEKEKAQLLIKEKEIKASVISLNQKDIANELKKYDFGFLFRDNILLNNVASPVKFLEYISNGVIPVTSKNIGDYSNEVIQRGIGVIETNDICRIVNEIVKIKSDSTVQSKLYEMSLNYTWDKYLDKMQ